MNGQRVYEYEATCEACGRPFTIGLTVPAETISEPDLARLIDAIHAPSCTVDVQTGDRL